MFVSEVLSLLITRACEDKLIIGIQINLHGPIISHIFFTDNTLFFLNVDVVNCNNLVKLINEYCETSGQQVNLQKSSVFFGANVPTTLLEELGRILWIPIVDNPGTYLGVSAMWGRSKRKGLAYVKEKILGKIQGWKHATLSQTGREVLIKVVVQAISAYPTNLFKFPATRCFMEFNDALLAKQCWRLIHEPSSLWVKVLKARYFLHCSFLDAKRRGRASWAWSSLLTGCDLLLRGTH